jgi:hypothetical protein
MIYRKELRVLQWMMKQNWFSCLEESRLDGANGFVSTRYYGRVNQFVSWTLSLDLIWSDLIWSDLIWSDSKGTDKRFICSLVSSLFPLTFLSLPHVINK